MPRELPQAPHQTTVHHEIDVGFATQEPKEDGDEQRQQEEDDPFASFLGAIGFGASSEPPEPSSPPPPTPPAFAPGSPPPPSTPVDAAAVGGTLMVVDDAYNNPFDDIFKTFFPEGGENDPAPGAGQEGAEEDVGDTAKPRRSSKEEIEERHRLEVSPFISK